MGAAKIRRGKSPFVRYPWVSAKELGLKGYAFVGTQKADFGTVAIVKTPWAQEAPPPILASPAVRASAPGTRMRPQNISSREHLRRMNSPQSFSLEQRAHSQSAPVLSM